MTHPAMTETFGGGWTRDNLLEAFKRLEGAKPLTVLLNNVTATIIWRETTWFGAKRSVVEDTSAQEELRKLILPPREDGDPDPKIYVTIHRDKVPDDQLRVFASDGRLHIWNFK